MAKDVEMEKTKKVGYAAVAAATLMTGAVSQAQTFSSINTEDVDAGLNRQDFKVQNLSNQPKILMPKIKERLEYLNRLPEATNGGLPAVTELYKKNPVRVLDQAGVPRYEQLEILINDGFLKPNFPGQQLSSSDPSAEWCLITVSCQGTCAITNKE